MNVSFIVMVGLPVLYATGSLHKAVAGAHVRGAAFLLYFLCIGALCVLPPVELTPAIRLHAAGLFVTVAPAVYLKVRHAYSDVFCIAAALAVLLAVSMVFLLSSYTLPYLPYLTGALLSLVAVLCFRAQAAVFVPVLTGIYGTAERIMRLLSGIHTSTAWFDDMQAASVGIALCLLVYSARRTKTRMPAPQHNKS